MYHCPRCHADIAIVTWYEPADKALTRPMKGVAWHDCIANCTRPARGRAAK